MRRGEIWEADLYLRSGSEQRGRRPVIIVSNDGFNSVASWQSIIVVPFSTSEKQRTRGPTAVPLKKGVAGLRKSSVALCHQLMTIDRSKLLVRWGALSLADLGAIEAGVLAAIDL